MIYTLLRYFLNQPDFNNYGIIRNKADLQKGFLISGDFGVGKSAIFTILHSMGKELITQVGCSDLWFPSISAGSLVEDYIKAAGEKESTFDLRKYFTGKLYIDDLGFEEKAFHRRELFAEILFERNKNRARTFVTTNLKPSEIAERYGNLIGDRLPEMFNIIIDHINKKKNLFHVVLTKNLQGVVKYNKTNIRPKEGDFLNVFYVTRRNKENKLLLEAIDLKPSNETDKNLMKEIEGTLEVKFKIDGYTYGYNELDFLDADETFEVQPSFGFVSDYYVPKSLLKKFKIEHNQYVKAKVLFTGDKWKVYDLLI